MIGLRLAKTGLVGPERGSQGGKARGGGDLKRHPSPETGFSDTAYYEGRREWGGGNKGYLNFWVGSGFWSEWGEHTLFARVLGCLICTRRNHRCFRT